MNAGAKRTFRPHPHHTPAERLSSRSPSDSSRHLVDGWLVQFFPLSPRASPPNSVARKRRDAASHRVTGPQHLPNPPQNPARNPGERITRRSPSSERQPLGPDGGTCARWLDSAPRRTAAPGAWFCFVARGGSVRAMAEARRHAIAPQLGERTERPAFSSLRRLVRPQLLIHLTRGMELAVRLRSTRRVLLFICLAAVSFWSV